jgi:predicted transcriptional regulator
MNETGTESVRISKELKRQLKELASTMRPRTAIQYLIEDAVEQYLDRVAEEDGSPYQLQKKPAKKKSGSA